VKPPELSNAPIKAAKNKRRAVMAKPILNSPMQYKYQTRSQTTIITKRTTNTPFLPRVITPMTGRAAPPKVPTLSQNLSPRNLSQDDFWNMETSNIAVDLGTNHWSQQHFANAVVHPVTGKQMEYMALMKDPDLQPLWLWVLATRQAAFFKASATSQEQAHVTLWKFLTSEKTEK
jgi:hypothetical protein